MNLGSPLARVTATLTAAGLLLAACAQSPGKDFAAAKEDGYIEARQLFERFVSLTNDYDTGLAELYAENAEILLIQRRAGGELRKISVAGSDFKELVPRMLPRAEDAGEQSRHDDVTFTSMGDRIRIESRRTNTPRGAPTPHILVVGPGPDGESWLIFEEIAVTSL